MGICFLHGNGGSGGGASLNFEVVGGTSQPSGASENTIWVNTNVGITSWIFSVTEPVSPVEGMVWFNTGNSSGVSFNALKENCLMVYPLSAVQYIGGEWVAKTATSYRDGVWVSWYIPGTLFANGSDEPDITGGWVSSAYSAGSGYDGVSEEITISSDGMYVALNDTSGANRSTFIGTKNKVNLTDYTKLTMEFSEASTSISGAGAVKACIYSDAGYTQVATADVLGATTGIFTGSVEVDVSGLSGEYYVGFFMWKWQAACIVTANMTLARLS